METQKGCFALAWQELRANDGWLTKCMLLALVSLVPILNFFCLGYGLLWAKRAIFSPGSGMPESVFPEGGFKLGFFAFVLALVFGVVQLLVNFGLLMIPILGWIASFVLSIFMTMFFMVCAVRIVLFDSLGEGFQLGEAWRMLTSDLSGLFCASWLPGFVFGVVGGVLACLAGLICSVLIIGAAAAGSVDTALLIVACAACLIVAFAVCVVVMAGCLVSFRATGHYIARNMVNAGWTE